MLPSMPPGPSLHTTTSCVSTCGGMRFFYPILSLEARSALRHHYRQGQETREPHPETPGRFFDEDLRGVGATPTGVGHPDGRH